MARQKRPRFDPCPLTRKEVRDYFDRAPWAKTIFGRYAALTPVQIARMCRGGYDDQQIDSFRSLLLRILIALDEHSQQYLKHTGPEQANILAVALATMLKSPSDRTLKDSHLIASGFAIARQILGEDCLDTMVDGDFEEVAHGAGIPTASQSDSRSKSGISASSHGSVFDGFTMRDSQGTPR